jgi:hypothetical protein
MSDMWPRNRGRCLFPPGEFKRPEIEATQKSKHYPRENSVLMTHGVGKGICYIGLGHQDWTLPKKVGQQTLADTKSMK